MSSAYSRRSSSVFAARSVSSSIAWSWLKKTALIAACGPITAIDADGSAIVASGSNAGPAIA